METEQFVESASAPVTQELSLDDRIASELGALDDADSDGVLPTEQPEAAASTDPSEAEEDQENEAEPEPPKDDSQLAHRMEAIQKAEERSRTQLYEYRAKVDADMAEREAALAPRLALADAFDGIKERARYDLGGVLGELGLSPEDMDAAARQVWSMRPEALSDPATQAAAQAAMRSRRHGDEIGEMRREIEALRKQNHDRASQEETREETLKREQFLSEYIDKVTGTASLDTPLAQQYITSSPEKAREAMRRIGDAMADEFNELPAPSDVMKRLEAERREDLRAFGIDPDSMQQAAQIKKNTKIADESMTAKTLTAKLGTPTRPREEPQTEEELDQEIARELEAMG